MAKIRSKSMRDERSDDKLWGCRFCVGVVLMFVAGVAMQFWFSSQHRYGGSYMRKGVVISDRGVEPKEINLVEAVPGPRCVLPLAKPSIGGDALPAILSGLGGGKDRLLVFEAGADAAFWLASNCRGETLLVQSDGEELARQSESVRAASRTGRYPPPGGAGVAGADPLAMVDNAATLSRLVQEGLPREAKASDWDEIIVGSSGSSPHLNIVAARSLLGPQTVVFIDSCDKPLQSAYVKRWLVQDGVKMMRYSNGRGGSVCRFAPTELSGAAVSSELAPSPATTFVVLGVVIAYAAFMACARMQTVKNSGPSKY